MAQQVAGSFGSRLRELREASGLTQDQLAERSGMNRFGVAKLEQGVREPSWATVQALAKALSVDCLAFTAEVDSGAQALKRGRGRPPKAPPSTPPAEELQAAKKPRARPRKK